MKEAEKLARDDGAGFMLVEPQEYEGPSGLAYGSCGLQKAFDACNLETLVEISEIPQGVRLISIPQNKEAPLRTHSMICGWYNISLKMWHYGVNPDMEHLRFFSCHELALTALTDKECFFFYVAQGRYDKTICSLALWSPLHSTNDETVQNVFRAAKAAAAEWLLV